MNAGAHAVVGIFTCWVALFAPGILLIFGVMPWWGVFRNFQVYRRCAGPVHMAPGSAMHRTPGHLVAALRELILTALGNRMQVVR